MYKRQVPSASTNLLQVLCYRLGRVPVDDQRDAADVHAKPECHRRTDDSSGTCTLSHVTGHACMCYTTSFTKLSSHMCIHMKFLIPCRALMWYCAWCSVPRATVHTFSEPLQDTCTIFHTGVVSFGLHTVPGQQLRYLVALSSHCLLYTSPSPRD